jgi:hypothetical protein
VFLTSELREMRADGQALAERLARIEGSLAIPRIASGPMAEAQRSVDRATPLGIIAPIDIQPDLSDEGATDL